MRLTDHKIMNLEQEKRERVLNAAMAEFTNGYKQASTDNIVREAGISKGLLYHYFSTKKELFLYLLEYAVQLMIDEYFSLINRQERDILEWWRQTTLLKYDLLKNHPNIFAFITKGFLEEGTEVEADVQHLKEAFVNDMSPQLFGNVDTSLYREDIPAVTITNMITTLMTSVAEEQTKGRKSLQDFDGSYDAMLKTVDTMIGYMRKLFYKRGA